MDIKNNAPLVKLNKQKTHRFGNKLPRFLKPVYSARIQCAHNLNARVEIVQIATVRGRLDPELDDLGALFRCAAVHYTVADDRGHVIKSGDESHNTWSASFFILLRPLTTHEFTKNR